MGFEPFFIASGFIRFDVLGANMNRTLIIGCVTENIRHKINCEVIIKNINENSSRSNFIEQRTL